MMCGYCIEAALCCNFHHRGRFVLPDSLDEQNPQPGSDEGCYALFESPEPSELPEPWLSAVKSYHPYWQLRVLEQELLKLPVCFKRLSTEEPQSKSNWPHLESVWQAALQQTEPALPTELSDAMLAEASHCLEYAAAHFYSSGDLSDGDASSAADFEALFPLFWLAFRLMQQHQPHNPVFRQLACSEPTHCPDFLGSDLLLIRHSLQHCVKQLGMPFLEQHANELRTELITYVLNANPWSPSELLQWQALLDNWQGREEVYGIGNAQRLLAELLAELA